MSPSHAAGLGAGPGAGVMVLPQASTTTGATGATASAGQLTVEVPSAGSVKSGMSIV